MTTSWERDRGNLSKIWGVSLDKVSDEDISAYREGTGKPIDITGTKSEFVIPIVYSRGGKIKIPYIDGQNNEPGPSYEATWAKSEK